MSDWHFGMDYDMWLYPPVPWDSPDWDFDLPEPIEAANIEGTLLVNAEDAIKQVRSLQAENARLRELVRALATRLAYADRVVDGGVMDARLVRELRELGIEVDE